MFTKGNFPLSDGPWGQPRKMQCHYETQPKKKIKYWYTQTLKNSSYPEWLLQLQALCSLKCYEEDRDQRQDGGGWQKGGVARSAAPDSDHTQTKWRLHVSHVRWQCLPFSCSHCHVGSPSSPSSDHTLCITHYLSHQCTLLSFKWVLSTFTIFKPLM